MLFQELWWVTDSNYVNDKKNNSISKIFTKDFPISLNNTIQSKTLFLNMYNLIITIQIGKQLNMYIYLSPSFFCTALAHQASASAISPNTCQQIVLSPFMYITQTQAASTEKYEATSLSITISTYTF